LTGSFRRAEGEHGDIDLLVGWEKDKTSGDGAKCQQTEAEGIFKALMQKLEQAGYITECLACSVPIASSAGGIRHSSGSPARTPRKNVDNPQTSPMKSSMKRYHWAAASSASSTADAENETLKFMGLAKLPERPKHRRLDILFVPKRIYPFSLVHFTGNALFNIELRNRALDMGFTLSEYGIKYANKNRKHTEYAVSETDTQKRIGKKKIETEEDVFKFFGLKTPAPAERKPNVLSKYII